LVFIQSKTSSGNILFAISIAFGSLRNCISCSWDSSMTSIALAAEIPES
jgi:hypothetical protein